VAEPSALFFDVGGVVLSNGWDRHARRRAIEKFDLDPEEFDSRHEMVVHAWEIGQFTRDEFESFLFSQSHPHADAIAVIKRYRAAKRWLMVTLNNESHELNEYRIKKFGLGDIFSIFLSSCYLGVRKPDEKIYRLALGITHRSPAESVFIDDRDINLEAATRLGMRVVHYRNPKQLVSDLARLGVRLGRRQ
jgi:putative hydrolase of the HAD superfamily